MKLSKPTIYLLLLIVSLGLNAYLFTNYHETKSVLKEYQALDQLNQNLPKFLQDFSNGKYKQYLTGPELAKYTQGEKQQNKSLERSTTTATISFKQLFVKPLENDRNIAESYSVMERKYTFGSDNPGDHYIQTLSINAHWVKVGEEWKVDNLKISMLNDTRDQILEKQAQTGQ